MPLMLGRSAGEGLERSCEGGDRVRSRGPVDGVELFQAWFSRRGFTRHRHDTYAIGVTESGVQVFDYRARVERSLPGQVMHATGSRSGPRPSSRLRRPDCIATRPDANRRGP